MNRLEHVTKNLRLRKRRIRKAVYGTAERPRLSVYVSNRHIQAQLIDDGKQLTLVHVTSVGQKIDEKTMTEKATWVGEEIAKKAKAAKIKRIVFDRNGRLYHGRLRSLADAARRGGMEF
jgi:large subunit ribosomal protein L18